MRCAIKAKSEKPSKMAAGSKAGIARARSLHGGRDAYKAKRMTFPLLELATNGCNIGNILGSMTGG